MHYEAGPRRRSTKLRFTLALATLALITSACGTSSNNSPEAGASSTKISGTLTILVQPTIYASMGGDNGLIKQFGDAHGVKVNVVTAATDDLLTKMLVEGSVKSSRYDLYTVQNSWMSAGVKPFLEPLNGYLKSAPATYDFNDIIKSNREAYQIPAASGDQYAIPWRVGTTMLYYRKDLLASKGITTPITNWDDFLAATKAFKGSNVFGLAQDMDPTGKTYLRYAAAYGASLLDDAQSKCAINSDGGVAALTLLTNIYRDGLVNPEALAWQRDPVIASLQQGRGALTVNFSPYWGLLVGKDAGAAAAQMAWGLVPTAPGVTPGRSLNDGWGLAINANSSNKAAAWALAEMLSGKDEQLKQAMDYANGSVRSSTYQDATYLAKFPLAKDWLTATAASSFLPAQPKISQMSDALNQEAAQSYLGKKSPKQALDDACKRIDPLIS